MSTDGHGRLATVTDSCGRSQTAVDVELVASAGTAGAALAAVGPLISARFGHKVICTLIFLSVVPGSALFGLSFIKSEFFRGWPSLVCLFQFIINAGNEMAFFTFVAVSGGNFNTQNAGKVTGLSMAAAGSGKAFHALLYQTFFQKAQDLGSFFFTIAILNFVLLPICFLFHKPYASEDTNEKIALLDLSAKNDIEMTTRETANEATSDKSSVSLRQMFQSVYFHLLFWPSVSFYAGELAIMNNITTLAKTVNIQQPLYLVYVLTVVLISSRISFGTIFDRFQSTGLGFGLLFVCYATFITAMVIAITCPNSVTVYLVTVLCGIGIGVGLLLPSVMLSGEFGVQYLGIISGLLFSAQSALNIMLQIVVGFLYDDARLQQKSVDIFCHGNTCFLWIWVVLLSITAIVTICEVVNFFYVRYYLR